MAAVRQALKDAGLGFGYGAIHAAIEGCVALGDIEAAIDVCVDVMGGGRSSSTKKSEPLGAKPTTFHALLRPLAMEGDGPAALAVLEHMVREAKALRRAAIHQEHWKEMQDAQQHDDEEDGRSEQVCQ